MIGRTSVLILATADVFDAQCGSPNAVSTWLRALRHAIEIVVETIDEEGTQGDLDERAERLQVNARAIWCRGDSRDEGYVIARQRRSAKEYEAAREAFAYAYRFETAREVLR